MTGRQRQLEALAPDQDGGRGVAEGDDQPDVAARFIGRALDHIFRRGEPAVILSYRPEKGHIRLNQDSRVPDCRR